jgi:hypothetical protein
VKRLRGAASGVAAASVEDCLHVLLSVDGYKRWYPGVVRKADVTARDEHDRPTRADVVLHIQIGPFSKDLPLLLDVDLGTPGTVRLSRVPEHASDKETFEVLWRVEAGEKSAVSVQLDANLDVPRLVPTAGIGDAMAGSLVRRATKEIESQAGTGLG